MLLRSIKVLTAVLIIGLASSASANSIFLSSQNINLSLGNIDIRSFDGAGFNNVANFNPNIPSTFLQFQTFDGGATGTEYEIFFLSSVADYKNQNTFGLMNEQGQFVSSINGSAALGSKVTYTQQPNQKLQLGFKSPESLFYSDASKNKDGRSHILSLQTSVNATLTIPKADLLGNFVSFNLLAGDILCFMEDMLADSNHKGALGGDFDFNDYLTVVRAKPVQVPEPGTLSLLGLGAFAAYRRRKAVA